MAWAPDYCTAAELKSWLRITDVLDDTLLAVAITAASRAVDGHCNRQFGQITTAATRYYTWDSSTVGARPALLIDDLYTTTDLAVTVDTDGDGDANDTVVFDTDFDLWPSNASADGRPWTALVLRSSSPYRWVGYHSAIAVTARFGWAAVPAAVKQATLLQASRLFGRRNAPFGVAGSPELGSEMRLLDKLDPDLQSSLASYVRHWGAV